MSPSDPAGHQGSAPPRSAAIRGFLCPLRVVATRLRFLVVFAAVFAIVGGWETIRAHWLRWTVAPAAEAVISSDTEFFCPMDPGVLADWPSKCPVCNMTLVRRKRGEAVPLPDGVMARMQFTPDRLALGGIRTEAVAYAPLARTLELPGVVREVTPAGTQVEADAFPRELAWLESGQAVVVTPVDAVGTTSRAGKILDLPRSAAGGSAGKVLVILGATSQALRVGVRAIVRVECPVARLEPFASQPTSPPPLGPDEPRRLYGCMEHPELVRDAAGRCPRDGIELMPRPLLGNQRVRWWCPMHPAVTADRAGSKCDPCGGMVLVPRVVSYRPEGRVLALPCSAAIDDGSRAIVYLDRGAGMFDARAVTLGPRCGAMFPVVAGLEPGDRVAAQGAFLIDAETRLNPGLAAGYFGAAGATKADGPTLPLPPVPTDEGRLTGLGAADRLIASRQQTCPVTGKGLGSMGVPFKLSVRGRAVFVCCEGCVGAVEADPGKFLAKLPPEGPEPRP